MDQEFTANPLSVFRSLKARETTEKEERLKRIIEHWQSGVFPTPEPIARHIAWTTDRHKILRHHPFWKERKLRHGFEALVSVALAAHLDLRRAEAALTAYANERDTFDSHVKHTVENPAQKEVMAFCAAYSGTIDCLRRLRKTRPELEKEIMRVCLENTGSLDFRFIFELRRSLSHGEVIVPGWNITTDETGTNGTLHLSRDELLFFGDWTVDIRNFLAEQPRSFAISEITSKCAQGLSKFRSELRLLFEKNTTEAERDYRALLSVSDRLSSRQWHKIVMNQIAEKGIDPYPFLHRYFTEAEVQAIERLPRHSLEQVEYMITLKQANTHCDDELRAILYRLFGAPLPASLSSSATPPKPLIGGAPNLGSLWPAS